MRHINRSRLTRFAFLASGAMLLFGSAAMAQTVQVFDDAPTLEQLRSIMIPESRPGLSRSIVLQRPDVSSASNSVQRASTQAAPAPAPRTPVEAAPVDGPVMQTAAVAAAPKSNPAYKSGEVAFHVNFAFNSAALPDSAQARSMIDMMAQLMKEAPDVKVRVEGHTDAKGSLEYNKILSERRALSVAQYLVKQGVEPSRLLLEGKGPTEPLTANPFDPANRRVQFVRVS
jgi:outer membrane protein OmpA-like peptidoglycan-associated protein